jgi:hypothetical protein
MPINETREVSVTIEAGTLAPTFVPLIDLAPGNIVIPNQCTLTVSGGVPSPLELSVMLCAPGTVLGDPGAAILQDGPMLQVEDGKLFVLEGNVPPLAQGGVLGLHIPVALLTTGAKVEGVLSIVR